MESLANARTNKLCKAGNISAAYLMSKGGSGGQRWPDTEAEAVIDLIDYRHEFGACIDFICFKGPLVL